VSVSLNEGSERHREVNIFIAVRIPNVRSQAAFQHDRAGIVHSGATRGRVHAFDQRFLGAFKPLF
jgi:hypothetical protein